MAHSLIRISGLLGGMLGAYLITLSTPQALGQTAPGSSPQPPPGIEATVPTAIRHAMEAQKYLFVFFHQTEDEQTATLRKVFESTMAKVSDRAESIIVNVKDPSHKPLVNKFGADRAPLPLVLAVAPNGAVTGGYPLKFTEQVLLGAFCSRSTWESLKVLQEGKLLLLCIQNPSLKSGPEHLKVAQEIKAEPQYAKQLEVVSLDPSDPAETDSLKRLSINPADNEAITILFAPPAIIINRFKGTISKDAIIAEIVKAAAGKGGCCPGGICGPRAPAPGAGPAAATAKPQPGAAASKAQSGAPVPQQRPGTPATRS